MITISSRFAVTTIWPDGSESGSGEIARAEMLYAPAGLAWLPAQVLGGQTVKVMVVDRHSGARLDLLPPDCEAPICALRWIGRVGSEHYGMVGATAATLGPGRDPRRICWQRISASGSSIMISNRSTGLVVFQIDLHTLDQPAGVALLGEPFTVDYALRLGPILTLHFCCHSTAICLIQTACNPAVAENLRFAPGRFGQGE